MNANTNTNTNAAGFSSDRFCAFARDAIIASGIVKTAGAGLSEQVWIRTRNERNELAVTQMRETFALWLAEQAPAVRAKCAKWRTSSPLAARLSECAKVIRFASETPERAAEVYACDSLSAALKLVRAAAKDAAGEAADEAAKAAPVDADVARIIAELQAKLATLPIEERAAAVIAAAAMLDAALSA